MENIFNSDFKDFINALHTHKVDYILVGGYAVILHGYNRTTGDLDIWVARTEENYKKLFSAFSDFGMPVFDMSEENFLHEKKFDVYTFGRPPLAIDIMLEVKGLDFTECFTSATETETNGLKIKLIDYRDLIRAKKASGRHKDLDDIEHLK